MPWKTDYSSTKQREYYSDGIITIPAPEGYGNVTRVEKEKGDTPRQTYKKPKSNISGKEGAKDVPSWAEGERPYKNESGKDFAKRLMDQRYGPQQHDTGPTSDFNKLKKYGDRAFE